MLGMDGRDSNEACNDESTRKGKARNVLQQAYRYRQEMGVREPGFRLWQARGKLELWWDVIWVVLRKTVVLEVNIFHCTSQRTSGMQGNQEFNSLHGAVMNYIQYYNGMLYMFGHPANPA